MTLRIAKANRDLGGKHLVQITTHKHLPHRPCLDVCRPRDPSLQLPKAIGSSRFHCSSKLRSYVKQRKGHTLEDIASLNEATNPDLDSAFLHRPASAIPHNALPRDYLGRRSTHYLDLPAVEHWM